MKYIDYYSSPFGELLISFDEDFLTGVSFLSTNNFFEKSDIYSCGGFNTCRFSATLCVVTKGIKADCNRLMRTTYPDSCVGVVDCKTQKPILSAKIKNWLDIYFSGKEPPFNIPIKIECSDFRKSVYEIVYKIPYGKTISYGEIAKLIANRNGLKKMSAQAIGRAISYNPVLIFLPCHRVIGVNGCLTGYSGGIERKASLLKLENVNCSFYT